MTTSEWDRVRTALEFLMNPVVLKVDGFQVTFMLTRIGVYKNAITVYVDGIFKVEWLTKDCDIRKRFTQRHQRSLYKQSEINGLPKKTQRDFLNKKYEFYDYHWTSFEALKKHILENNKVIELISIKFEPRL